MDYGIDISNYQGSTITWSAVKEAEISFASILQTDTNEDGSPFVNPYAGTQVSGARSVGIVTGGYHFARPGIDYVDQVGRFVSQLERNGLLSRGSFLPVLDMEESAGGVDPNQFVADFKSEFTRRTGTGLIVYANLSWWQTLLYPDQWADDRTWLWLALYNGQPADTGGWTHPRLALHQSTDKGAVPGFIGLVDRDETINGFSLADLIIGNEGRDMGTWFKYNDGKTVHTGLLLESGKFYGLPAPSWASVVDLNADGQTSADQYWNDLVTHWSKSEVRGPAFG